MKKIRIDYYYYRLKKGRANVLLQKNEKEGEVSIPFHFVQDDERIDGLFPCYHIEDDGDLVINIISLNNCHLNKTNKEWVPLGDIRKVTLSRNESFHIWHNILRFFLTLCPEEGESGIIHKTQNMLEDLLVDMAKKEYRDWLQKLLDEPINTLDASVSQPDPELVRKEMETMEHFRLYKPNDEPMNLFAGELIKGEKYSFKRVKLEVFGYKITRTNPP